MKIIKLIVLATLLLTLVVSKSLEKKSSHKKKALTHHKSKGKKSGKKCPGSPAPVAPWQNLNYPDIKNDAYVNSDPYILQNQAGFKDATIWPGTLPENLNYFPYTGVFKSADTGVHNKFYYDGSIHLGKVAQVHCDMYTTQPRACVNEKGCGWCGQSNTCIGANALGPISPCIRSTFIYTLPSAEWNPLKAAPINIHAQDSNGNSLLKVTHEPDLSQAPVNKPYQLE